MFSAKCQQNIIYLTKVTELFVHFSRKTRAQNNIFSPKYFAVIDNGEHELSIHVFDSLR